MIQSEICELLGIQYPVFQGGMAWIADGNLAAAVSNGGGLGIIAAGNAPEGGAVFRFTLPVEELSMEDTSHEDQGKDPHHRG